MISKLQIPAEQEKRRYIRYPVNDWLLLFNAKSLTDMAQVVNISQGGVLCACLADCPPDMAEEMELYGLEDSLSVNGLNGKIVHTDYNKLSFVSPEEINCFVFGLQFSQTTPDQLRKIEQISRMGR